MDARLLDETIVADGRRYRVAWFDPPFRPPLTETTQALGICVSPQRRIVLVTWNGRQWSLPGGSVEPGETLERTLAREVLEEACARVLACRYIGCQRVEELDGEAGAYYQTRFWARVELNPFRGEHEMTARQLVEADEFLSTLFLGRRGDRPPDPRTRPGDRRRAGIEPRAVAPMNQRVAEKGHRLSSVHEWSAS